MLLRCTGQMLCGIPQFVRPSWCLAAFGLLFGALQAAGAAPSTAPPSAAEAAPPGHSGSAGRRSIRSARPRWRLRPAGCSRSVSKYKIHLIVSANIDKGKDYTKYNIKTLINWYRAANKYLVKLNTVQFFLLPGWRGCPGAASWLWLYTWMVMLPWCCLLTLVTWMVRLPWCVLLRTSDCCGSGGSAARCCPLPAFA